MSDLAGVIEEGIAALGIPGAAVAVVRGDEVETVCRGVTDFRHPLEVDERTIFQIGSISKTFCGSAAIALGLDLDAPIRTWVPDLHDAGVTLRHVFTHTTGWVGDYFKDTGEGDDALALFVKKLAKAPRLTPLGSTYSYANSAFNLAAHAIASAHGTSYERAVRDLVIEPLGLEDTFFDAESAIGRRVAIGHRDGRPQRWRRPRAHNGNGGVLSCVADLVRYARFHLQPSPMHETQRPAGSLCDETAIVWYVDDHNGRRVVHHGGTTNGYQADLRLVQDEHLAWVMLTNSDHHHQLDRMIREHLLGPPTPVADVAVDDLEQYAGVYEAVLAEVEVVVRDTRLVALVGTPERAKWDAADPSEPPVPTRLAFRDREGRVEALDMPWQGHRGEFLRAPDGSVEWFRWDGRIARRKP